jgi:hypothetical protein
MTLAFAALFAAGFLSGCQRGSGAGAPAPAAQAQPAAGPPPAQAQPAAPAQPPVAQQTGTHVGEKTKEILNALEMVKDPNWTVVASDPREVQGNTFVGTAYNRAAALAGTANLEKWIQLEQAQSESGSFPTYAALKEYIDHNPVDMPRLREYHHYGYDETTGQVVILENKAEKDARHKELGLPVGQ